MKQALRAVHIEDDPTFRELISIYLEEMGFEVHQLAEGKSAMQRLAGLAPDLVCLDLVLPQFSGYEICEFIRRTAALRTVPVLMTSSRGQPTDRAHAEEAGVNAYLVKPFSHAEFRREVVALVPQLSPKPTRKRG
jgi:two-component system chemotaxis response regulator CheY